MKYTYTITTGNDFNGPLETAQNRSSAISAARRMVEENPGENVYIKRQHPHGASCYLNPCGNFECTGKSWA